MKNNPTRKARILNIQHFCVDDGPGIRTTVFFKGCPLHCVWCHNPETHDFKHEVFYRSEKCRGCGTCIAACKNHAHVLDANGTHQFLREHCTQCGACTASCVFEALEYVGNDMTVAEVLSDVLSDAVFYQTSGGGVTLSGGEPTAQPQFAKALLAACKEHNVHTAMETCGYCSPALFAEFIPLTDLFLFDWKISDEKMHLDLTGVSNRPILENLELLARHNANVTLRCPIIPDINLTREHFETIAELAKRFPNIARIDLEPYHPLGVSKSHALGKIPKLELRSFLEKDALRPYHAYLTEQLTIPVHLS